MRRQQQGRLFRIAVPIVAGAVVGTVGAVGYAALCGVIAWVATGSWQPFLAWVVRFVVAGPIAGTVMGVCLAIDWSRKGDETGKVAASAEPGAEAPSESETPTGAWGRLQPYWERMRMRR